MPTLPTLCFSGNSNNEVFSRHSEGNWPCVCGRCCPWFSRPPWLRTGCAGAGRLAAWGSVGSRRAGGWTAAEPGAARLLLRLPDLLLLLHLEKTGGVTSWASCYLPYLRPHLLPHRTPPTPGASTSVCAGASSSRDRRCFRRKWLQEVGVELGDSLPGVPPVRGAAGDRLPPRYLL